MQTTSKGAGIVDDPEVSSSLLMKSPTIYDVAKIAGVSPQTVSRLLRGFEGIRPVTRDKVQQAMEQLQYRPNAAARALKAGRSHRIAALTHEVTQVGPSAIIRGATAAAREAGYLLDVVSLDVESVDAVSEALVSLRGQDLDGIIALASTDEMSAALDAVIFNMDIVRADEPDDTSGPSSSDLSTHAIPTLMDHLYELGHRRLLHVAGPPNWAAARNRRAAFERAALDRGMSDIVVVYGDWSAASGHRAVCEGVPRGVTALVAANDQMALGAVHALHQAGISVPDEISVTGIDDIPEAEFFIPPLSTIRVDFELQGRHAINLALRRLGVEVDVPHVSLSSQVVLRQSTGRHPS